MSLNSYLNIGKTFIDVLEHNEFDVKHCEISLNDLVFSPFVHLKCMNCGMFRRNYHCLAVPRWKKANEKIMKYNHILIIYIIANNRLRIEQLKLKSLDNVLKGKNKINDYIIKKNACKSNQTITYYKMKKFLIMLRDTFPNKKMELFGAGGGCTSCKPCGLVYPQLKGKPVQQCKNPQHSFTSPESWGIDVYATLSNINIKYEIIPINQLINVGMILYNE